MFRVTEIRELIRLMDETSVVELEVESEGARLSIRKAQAAAPIPAVAPAAPAASAVLPQAAPVEKTTAIQEQTAPATPEPRTPESKSEGTGNGGGKSEVDASLYTITSPMVGTFYRAPAPDADPYVQVGSRVDEKTIVCIVEAMKLMNEIEADCRGEIVEILAENGQLVEFGQPLFRVRLD
ncbi:acetyl-CoA carboxylase biotin carboxyl carrier protein [Kyrpidia sp.]|uniref:acetyl-CoA carboxylase biotin carboxyl carrier protein n=1 Tax=Kyrpidia sp. TaxID=2073077 RepID=UPI002589FB2A|nr:acetyl-CoA carboxylase biotin carboxyl carrier protein [Kyrpidia sp.]MCL6576018.1 acetyl-CoA carboxylase biotin carboxyl carrier protein [Kyrpidia sp.]